MSKELIVAIAIAIITSVVGNLITPHIKTTVSSRGFKIRFNILFDMLRDGFIAALFLMTFCGQLITPSKGGLFIVIFFAGIIFLPKYHHYYQKYSKEIPAVVEQSDNTDA